MVCNTHQRWRQLGKEAAAVISCSARKAMEGLSLGEQRERKRGEDLWRDHLMLDRHGLPELGTGIQWWVGARDIGGDGLWDPQGMWEVGEGGCSCCSFVVLGIRLRNWVCVKRESRGLQAAYLVFWDLTILYCHFFFCLFFFCNFKATTLG